MFVVLKETVPFLECKTINSGKAKNKITP